MLFAPIAWIGRQRARAVLATTVLGVAFPPVGIALKPFVTPAIGVMLIIAFARVDAVAMRGYLVRPGLLIAATAWTMAAVPLGYLALAHTLALPTTNPALHVSMAIHAMAPPMMSAPAFAILLGLDATLVLAMMVSGVLMIPITAMAWTALFGLDLALAPLDLALRLVGLLTGAGIAGAALRSALGQTGLDAARDTLDGVNIIALYVFVAALFGPAVSLLIAEPLRVAGLTLLVFVVFFALLVVTAAAFAWAGRERAAAIALRSAMRNMGLMLAGIGGGVPDTTWLYIAMGQLPLYLAPMMLPPLLAWWRRRG